jgi:hypothetical protein
MADTKPISDSSSLNISLPMLFQAIGLIGAMVWEYQVSINEEHISRLEEDAKANQNAEIPADIKQNQRIEYLEKEIDRLRSARN